MIRFVHEIDPQLCNTPPRFIVQVATQLAIFPKTHNEDEGYLTEQELSREVQKALRQMHEEE